MMSARMSDTPYGSTYVLDPLDDRIAVEHVPALRDCRLRHDLQRDGTEEVRRHFTIVIVVQGAIIASCRQGAIARCLMGHLVVISLLR